MGTKRVSLLPEAAAFDARKTASNRNRKISDSMAVLPKFGTILGRFSQGFGAVGSIADKKMPAARGAPVGWPQIGPEVRNGVDPASARLDRFLLVVRGQHRGTLI
jgi:hypothetical protein